MRRPASTQFNLTTVSVTRVRVIALRSAVDLRVNLRAGNSFATSMRQSRAKASFARTCRCLTYYLSLPPPI